MSGWDVGAMFANQKGFAVSKKSGDITAPAPTQCHVFLDEHQNSIDDGTFGVAPEGDMWFNLPANWHSAGCNFSFADGHSEHWRWRDSRTLKLDRINSITHRNPSNVDLKDSKRRLRPSECLNSFTNSTPKLVPSSKGGPGAWFGRPRDGSPPAS
jgi:prepilin-type processing-associated H-X9-DG protein